MRIVHGALPECLLVTKCALLVSALAACGPVKPQPIVLAPPAAASPEVNGRYRGTSRLVRAAGPYCPRSGARVLEVTGGAISLSYSAAPRQRVSLIAPIAADGRIQANDGVGTIDGQVVDGRLEVTVSSQHCEHRWTLTRVD